MTNKTTVKPDINNGTIIVKKGILGLELRPEEAIQLQRDLKEAVYVIEKERKSKETIFKKISLKHLYESLEDHTITWDDVIGFDFCVTRFENGYPATESEGKLLLKEEMTYTNVNYGHEYKRDFHWVTSEMPDIEENFLEEQAWDEDSLTLEEIKLCLDDDFIQYVIDHPEFELYWNSYPISSEDLKSDGMHLTFEFGSNYDS